MPKAASRSQVTVSLCSPRSQPLDPKLPRLPSLKLPRPLREPPSPRLLLPLPLLLQLLPSLLLPLSLNPLPSLRKLPRSQPPSLLLRRSQLPSPRSQPPSLRRSSRRQPSPLAEKEESEVTDRLEIIIKTVSLHIALAIRETIFTCKSFLLSHAFFFRAEYLKKHQLTHSILLFFKLYYVNIITKVVFIYYLPNR
jgi:hypothetical protein